MNTISYPHPSGNRVDGPPAPLGRVGRADSELILEKFQKDKVSIPAEKYVQV
jgi:hypothetical protein